MTERAFSLPADRELSTFLTTRLPDQEIWTIGTAVLYELPRTPATLYGRADFNVRALSALKLRAVRDDNPSRHVNVGGWPAADDKGRAKLIAQELAKASSLELLQPPLVRP